MTPLPDWSKVFNSQQRIWGDVEECRVYAANGGYGYFEWNGVVYSTASSWHVTRTAVCTVEEMEAGERSLERHDCPDVAERRPHERHEWRGFAGSPGYWCYGYKAGLEDLIDLAREVFANEGEILIEQVRLLQRLREADRD